MWVGDKCGWAHPLTRGVNASGRILVQLRSKKKKTKTNGFGIGLNLRMEVPSPSELVTRCPRGARRDGEVDPQRLRGPCLDQHPGAGCGGGGGLRRGDSGRRCSSVNGALWSIWHDCRLIPVEKSIH